MIQMISLFNQVIFRFHVNFPGSISPQKNATNKVLAYSRRVFPTQKDMFEAVSAIRHWGISLSGHAHIKYILYTRYPEQTDTY